MKTEHQILRPTVVGLVSIAVILAACSGDSERSASERTSCDPLEIAKTVVDFFSALKQGDESQAMNLLAEEEDDFDAYGFFGVTAGQATTRSRSEVADLVRASANSLNGVQLADVAVSTSAGSLKADVEFRLVSEVAEEVGKGADRCSDYRLITFNFALVEEPLGSNQLTCVEDLGSIGDTRACLRTTGSP